MRRLPLHRDELTDFCLLARYHSRFPAQNSPAYCSYQRIAALLTISPTTVRKICCHALPPADTGTTKVSKRSKRIQKP